MSRTCHAVLCLVLFGLVALQPVSASASQAAKPWLRRHAAKSDAQSAPQTLPAPSEASEESAPLTPAATTVVETSEDEDEAPVAASSAQPASDGNFPQLPAVSTMLGTASETLKRIEAEVSQVESLEPTKMAKQKAQFEDSLRKQDQENRGVVAANARITANITSLKAGNDELRKRAKELQDGNRLMRVELHSLDGKIGSAKEFIASSLQSTDDSKAHDLEVLGGNTKPTQHAQQAPLHKRHRHGFIQITSDDVDDDSDSEPEQGVASDGPDGGDDSNDAGLSLLALSARSHRATARRAARVEESAAVTEFDNQFLAFSQTPALSTPAIVSPPAINEKQLIQGLSTGVAELGKEAQASETKLEAIFNAHHQGGAKRHEALLSQQKQLKATRKALRELKSKLSTAVKHLEGTQKHLEARRHALGLFMQKIAHVLLAPPSEASKLLDALPKEVGQVAAAP